MLHNCESLQIAVLFTPIAIVVTDVIYRQNIFHTYIAAQDNRHSTCYTALILQQVCKTHGTENANFWKQVSKRKFWKMILLSFLCKLRKREFVKPVTSPTVGLACIIQQVFLQIHVNGDCFANVVICKQKKHKEKYLAFLVCHCRVNLALQSLVSNLIHEFACPSSLNS